MKSSDTFNKNRVKTVVWDWNGTLLNDVHLCVYSTNEMLAQRNLPLLDYNTYRQIFGFPVRRYYEEAGFNFLTEPFQIVASQFIEIYRRQLNACNLFSDAFYILGFIKSCDMMQYVLSAMEQQLLETSLSEKGIIHFFEFISGTGDDYANGKLDSARKLQQTIGFEPENILLIGDTIHDHEVAEEMGWQNLLIANGHQSFNRLKATGRPVLDNLTSITKYLNGLSF